MITVEVQGFGSFTINAGKVNELLGWLKSNSMPLEAIRKPYGDDEVLINE